MFCSERGGGTVSRSVQGVLSLPFDFFMIFMSFMVSQIRCYRSVTGKMQEVFYGGHYETRFYEGRHRTDGRGGAVPGKRVAGRGGRESKASEPAVRVPGPVSPAGDGVYGRGSGRDAQPGPAGVGGAGVDAGGEQLPGVQSVPGDADDRAVSHGKRGAGELSFGAHAVRQLPEGIGALSVRCAARCGLQPGLHWKVASGRPASHRGGGEGRVGCVHAAGAAARV